MSVTRRFPGPFEGPLLMLGAAAVGVALFEATHARWGPLVGAVVFAVAMFAGGAWSHARGRRRRY